MEKFEITSDAGLDVFKTIVTKTKESITEISKDIKANIKKYDKAIDNTEKDIQDATSARLKCEDEIAKREGNIEAIKQAIDNVESTYKNIESAYASTSKGETKSIYSDIINEAKANCEKDVEKNRTEIARLNSEIEGIKNNIQEFNHSIEELNNNLDAYKLELMKYEKSNDYFEKMKEKMLSDLQDIEDSKLPKSKSTTKKTTTKKEEPVVVEEVKNDANTEFSNPVLDALEVTSSFSLIDPETGKSLLDENYDISKDVEETKKETEEAPKEDLNNNIFDFTSATNEDNSGFQNNLENLFNTPSEDVKEEKANYDDADMSEWESILNGSENLFDIPEVPEVPNNQIIDLTGNVPVLEEPITKEKEEENNDLKELNELLKPYNTTYDKLKSDTGATIKYKDGKTVPFNMTVTDVINAVNSIDANDLRNMKIVGPEITILRRVKAMKEGK